MQDERGGPMHEQTSTADRSELAWVPDIAAEFSHSAASGALSHFQPVEPNPTTSFVQARAIKAQIVCGGRGMGKSTLLLYRIRHVRQHLDAVFVRNVPPHGFRLAPNTIRIPKQAFWQFSAVEPWVAAWRIVLGCLFAFAIKRRADASLAANRLDDWLKVFGVERKDDFFHSVVSELQRWGNNPHDQCVAEMIEAILRFRPSVDAMNLVYEKKIRPLYSERLQVDGGEKHWVVFVDAIDEACSDFATKRDLLHADLSTSYVDNKAVTAENVQVLAQQIWVNAQTGYALAAHDIKEASNSQLNAFGTIRSETFPSFVAYSNLTQSKIDFFVLRIGVTDRLLRAVFNLNVDLMGESERIAPKAGLSPSKDVAAGQALCGVHQVYSRTVFPYAEDVFSLLARHSFKTPRGLVMLGGEVRNLSVSPRDDGADGRWRHPRAVIEVVNRKAKDVLREYLDTLFPPWDPSYESAFNLFQSNILDRAQVDEIERQFALLRPSAPQRLIDYLYGVGLVGIPALEGPNDSAVQRFWIPGEIVRPLPEEYGFVILHPAFSAYVRDQLSARQQLTFYSRELVANPGGNCPVVLRRPIVRVMCSIPDATLKLFWVTGGGQQQIFGDANTVGCAFLAVLCVAQKYHETPRLGVDEFVHAAKVLSSLRLIPSLLGRDKSPVDAFFRSVFDTQKYHCVEKQPTAVADAKRLLDSKDGLTVDAMYRAEGNEYTLARIVSGVVQSLEAIEIAIEGLSTLDFVSSGRTRGPREVRPHETD